MALQWQSSGTTYYAANASETAALTVPAGMFYRIRHIRLINTNGSTQGVTLSNGTSVAAKFFRTSATKLLSGQSEDMYVPIWLTPTQSINAQTDVGNGMIITFNYDIYT